MRYQYKKVVMIEAPTLDDSHTISQGTEANPKTPQRRLALLWGVLCFSMHFCYFSRVLFGGKEKFCIFAIERGVDNIAHS